MDQPHQVNPDGLRFAAALRQLLPAKRSFREKAKQKNVGYDFVHQTGRKKGSGHRAEVNADVETRTACAVKRPSGRTGDQNQRGVREHLRNSCLPLSRKILS
jgi:hypothetical protein